MAFHSLRSRGLLLPGTSARPRPAEDFRRDSDLFAAEAAKPEFQGRIAAAMKRGFQIKSGAGSRHRGPGCERPPLSWSVPASRAARGTQVERNTSFALGHRPELRDGPVHADPAQDRLANRGAVVDEQRAVEVAALCRRVGGGA